MQKVTYILNHIPLWNFYFFIQKYKQAVRRGSQPPIRGLRGPFSSFYAPFLRGSPSQTLSGFYKGRPRFPVVFQDTFRQEVEHCPTHVTRSSFPNCGQTANCDSPQHSKLEEYKWSLRLCLPPTSSLQRPRRQWRLQRHWGPRAMARIPKIKLLCGCPLPPSPPPKIHSNEKKHLLEPAEIYSL